MAMISVHLGTSANRVGAHFWNAQHQPNVEQVDENVLFRRRRKTQLVPRLLCVDFRVNIGHNLDFGTEAVDVDTMDAMETVKIEQTVTNKNTWSSLYFSHLDSECILGLSSLSSVSFDVFHSGNSLYKDEGDQLEDGVRRLAEMTDDLQGFQVLHDSFNGFAGVCDHFGAYLKDEFEKKSRFVFPVSPGVYESYDAAINIGRLTNNILGLNSDLEHGSLVTPLSLDNDVVSLPGHYKRMFGDDLINKFDVAKNGSAILGLGLDNMSLLYRAKDHNNLRLSPAELLQTIKARPGQKLAASAVALFDVERTNLKDISKEQLVPFLPIKRQDHVFCTQSLITRARRSEKKTNFDDVEQELMSKFVKCRTVYSHYHRERKIKPKSLPENEFLDTLSTGVVTSWHQGDDLAKYLSLLCERGKKVKVNKLSRFSELGLEQEELDSALETLNSLSDDYADD